MRKCIYLFFVFVFISKVLSAQVSRYSKYVPLNLPKDNSVETFIGAMGKVSSRIENSVNTNWSRLKPSLDLFNEYYDDKESEGCVVKPFYDEFVTLLNNVDLGKESSVDLTIYKVKSLTKKLAVLNCNQQSTTNTNTQHSSYAKASIVLDNAILWSNCNMDSKVKTLSKGVTVYLMYKCESVNLYTIQLTTGETGSIGLMNLSNY